MNDKAVLKGNKVLSNKIIQICLNIDFYNKNKVIPLNLSNLFTFYF